MQSKFQGTETVFRVEYQHTANTGIMCKHLIRAASKQRHSAGILLSLVPTCHGRAQLGWVLLQGMQHRPTRAEPASSQPPSLPPGPF